MLGDREFEYHLPISTAAWAITGAGGTAVLVGIFLIKGVAAMSGGRPAAGLFWMIPALFFVMGVVRMVRELNAFRKLAVRGLVQVTGVGLSATDHRGETQSILWDEATVLTERRAIWTTLGPQPACRLELRGGGKSVRIYRTVDDYDRLVDSILNHAGLVRLDASWWGTRYIRPDPGIESP